MAVESGEARAFRMLSRPLANIPEANEELERSLEEEFDEMLSRAVSIEASIWGKQTLFMKLRTSSEPCCIELHRRVKACL